MRTALSLLTVLATSCAAAPEPLDGCWLTRGYGTMFELEDHVLRIYEVRSLGTLPSGEAHRLAADPSRFLSEDIGLLTITQRGSDGETIVRLDGSNHDVVLDETDRRPQPVRDEWRDDPVFNFDWFAATFREHYAFFDLRGVNWEALVAEHRTQVTADTSDEELLAIFGAMIAPLEDGHVWVESDDDEVESGRDDHDEDASDRFDEFQDLALEYAEDEGPVRACRGRLVAAKMESDVGYLRLDGMYGEIDELEGALDRAFEHLGEIDGLVVDLRFNGGGMDTYGFRLASRLTAEAYVAAEKQVRSDPDDPRALHDVGSFTVEPSSRPGFHGPVALLVSRYTASAAEVFGMAALARKPRAHLFGEQSASIFSDVFGSELPNGWTVALSNEVYRMADGRCFEAIGLPLDVELMTLNCGHLETREDPALESALEWLSTQ